MAKTYVKTLVNNGVHLQLKIANSPALAPAGMHQLGYFTNDPVLQWLRLAQFELGWFDAETLCGNHTALNQTRFESHIHVPGYSPRYDWRLYGSWLGALKNATSPEQPRANTKVERRLKHGRITADVHYVNAVVLAEGGTESSISQFGLNRRVYEGLGQSVVTGFARTIDSFQLSINNVPGIEASLPTRVEDIMGFIEAGRWTRIDFNSPGYFYGQPVTYWLDTLEPGDSQVVWAGRIRFHSILNILHYVEYTYKHVLRYDVDHQVFLSEMHALPQNGVAESWIDLKYQGHTFPPSLVTPNDLNRWTVMNVIPIYGLHTATVFGDGLGSAVPHDKAVVMVHDVVRDFRKTCDNDFEQVSPAAFYSTASAFEKHTETIQSNHLETLSELADTARLHEGLTRLVTDLSRASRIRHWADKLTSVADALTALNLWYHYGLTPVKDGAKELVDSWPALFDECRQGIRAYTLYGKFVYELPYAHLTVRSKIRYTFEVGHAATLVLGLLDAGLLPSFSNVYQTLKLSFALDWFYNLSRRMKDAETRIFMLTMGNGRCVHTYHYVGTSKGIPVDYYRREISAYLPPIKQSIYDFREVNGPADVITAGSLAWALKPIKS